MDWNFNVAENFQCGNQQPSISYTEVLIRLEPKGSCFTPLATNARIPKLTVPNTQQEQ
jgi:hypothetical protein